MENRRNFACAKFGARRPRVEEPLSWAVAYPIQWRESRVDLAELARLRWINGLSVKQLAKEFGRTEYAIGNYCQNARRKKFDLPGLSAADKRIILQEIGR